MSEPLPSYAPFQKGEPMGTCLRTFLVLCLALFAACGRKGKEEENSVRGVPTEILTPALFHPSPEATPQAQLVLAAAPESLADEKLEYVVDEVKGKVLVQSGSDDPVTAEEDLVVDPGDHIVTGPGSEATLTLNQDTLFHVYENSDVEVAQLGKQGSAGFLSRLNLMKGKVLSEVEKLAVTHSTFEVESGGVVCGVRGTGFEVQKEGDEVHTRTFHGLVEMQGHGTIQRIGEGSHGIFSGKVGRFLTQRRLETVEKGRYQKWLGMKRTVQERQGERAKALAQFRGLPPAERRKALEGWKGNDRHQRLRFLRGAVGGQGGWASRHGEPGQGPRDHRGPERGGPRNDPRHRDDQRPHRDSLGRPDHSQRSPGKGPDRAGHGPRFQQQRQDRQDHQAGSSGRQERNRPAPGERTAPGPDRASGRQERRHGPFDRQDHGSKAPEEGAAQSPASSDPRQERRHGPFDRQERGSKASEAPGQAQVPGQAPTPGGAQEEKKEQAAPRPDALQGLRKLFAPRNNGQKGPGERHQAPEGPKPHEEKAAGADKKEGETKPEAKEGPQAEEAPSGPQHKGPGHGHKNDGDEKTDEDNSQDDPGGRTQRHHGPRDE